MKGEKVFVGLSGGVDSAVSAALLKKDGYVVTGVFIRGWYPDWLPCTWKEERRDAMRVAAHLDIPFLTFDASDVYKQAVAEYSIQEYAKGRTPNPDVLCNKEVKFGAFYTFARTNGASYIATGHYAQAINGQLYEGADQEKDQSYFLWTLPHDVLKRTIFPIGHMQKKDVRAYARSFNLPNAEKKDSQGICFLGKISMKEFIAHYIPSKQGAVINERGETIGMHDGAMLYTYGERHGFKLTHPVSVPHYVIAKDIEKNTITVSPRETIHQVSKPVYAVRLDQLYIREPVLEGKELYCRIRYRQVKQSCTLSGAAVRFSNPQEGVAPGQSLVIYDGNKCIGGGSIDHVIDSI